MINRNSPEYEKETVILAQIDLTTGSIPKTLLRFAFPMICGNLLQQLYNVADTLIVGRFLGSDALGAVGSSYTLMTFLTSILLGLCMGSGALFSVCWGQRDLARLRRQTHAAFVLIAVCTVVLNAAAFLLLDAMKTLLSVPAEVWPLMRSYLFVIFLGIPAIILYNLVSGVIRSLGDSRTPIYFLVLSSLLNVALDLLAVAVLGMGVEGPAWATVISQAISGLLCLAIMGKRYPVLRFRPGELRPSRTHITRLFAIGVPMGLQYSITAIGTIVVQTAVNGLGAVSIAAVTAANKVSQLFTCPFDAAGTTMAVYGGQNYGAMKLDRIHRGVRACVLLMFAYSALGLGVLALFGGKLSLLFLDSAESAAVRDQIGLLAQQFLVWNASCYFLLTLVNVLRFLIQGVGFTQQAVFAGVFETIARCFVGFAVVRWIGYTAICLANPAAWLLADCFLVPIYFHDMHLLQRRFAQRRAEA